MKINVFFTLIISFLLMAACQIINPPPPLSPTRNPTIISTSTPTITPTAIPTSAPIITPTSIPNFLITATAGTGGIISPIGGVQITYGNSQIFNITPNEGFDIYKVLVDGINQGLISSYTFNYVTANHTINASFATWLTVGTANISGGAISTASIAIDRNGTPYVAYSDVNSVPSYRATVKKYNGNSWVVVGSANFSPGSADYLKIAISDNGTPYVIFSDGASGHGYKAMVMKYNGSSWVSVGNADFSDGQADWTSIAIYGNTPYIAYSDDINNNGAVTVMKFNGSSWLTVGNAGFTASNANYTSIAIDSNGIPYIVYTDGHHSPYAANVVMYNGSNWVTVGSPDFSSGEALWTSIAIDSSNTPYVVFADSSYSRKIRVMKYNGIGWVSVGSAGFSAGIADYCSIAIDVEGRPYVAFKDRVGGGATVMYFNGSSWSSVGNVCFSVGTASYTSIAIGSNNIPYIGYQDSANSSGATVMKYSSP